MFYFCGINLGHDLMMKKNKCGSLGEFVVDRNDDFIPNQELENILFCYSLTVVTAPGGLDMKEVLLSLCFVCVLQ